MNDPHHHIIARRLWPGLDEPSSTNKYWRVLISFGINKQLQPPVEFGPVVVVVSGVVLITLASVLQQRLRRRLVSCHWPLGAPTGAWRRPLEPGGAHRAHLTATIIGHNKFTYRRPPVRVAATGQRGTDTHQHDRPEKQREAKKKGRLFLRASRRPIWFGGPVYASASIRWTWRQIDISGARRGAKLSACPSSSCWWWAAWPSSAHADLP